MRCHARPLSAFSTPFVYTRFMTPDVFETAARITAEATVFPAFAWNVQIASQPILRGFRMLGAVKFSLRGIPHRVREFGTDLTHDEYQVFH